MLLVFQLIMLKREPIKHVLSDVNVMCKVLLKEKYFKYIKESFNCIHDAMLGSRHQTESETLIK